MNIDEILKKREQVCALADGQVEGAEFAAAVELVVTDDDARATWHVYHLVGDVLRSRELAACGHDRDFVSRLSARLQAEPAAPRGVAGPLDATYLIADNDPDTLGSGQKHLRAPEAANDGSFRWKLVAGLASLAAVAAIGWNALGALDGAATGARLAQSSPVPAASGAPVMIRDPRLDELLAAHRQFGGTSALQNPSGFLRNATFEGAAR